MKVARISGCVLMLTTLAVACGGEADDAETKGSSSTSGTSSSGGDGDAATTTSTTSGEDATTTSGQGATTTSGAGDVTTMNNACDPTNTGEEDCPDYVSCVENKCVGAYKTCLGTGFESGNFSGGVCESYMNCVSHCDQSDSCDTSCVQNCQIDGACQACLTDEVGSCVVDECSAELQACALGDLGGLNFEGGCDELAACCASLSASEKSDCQAAYDGVSPAGDLGCGAVLASYRIAGSCE